MSGQTHSSHPASDDGERLLRDGSTGLDGRVRNDPRHAEDRLLSDDLPTNWWRTPCDVGTGMVLFESDAVHRERARLIESLARISLDVGEFRRSKIASGDSHAKALYEQAAAALELVDRIRRTIREDMLADLPERGTASDWPEKLDDLDVHAQQAANRATLALREHLCERQ